MIKRKEVLQRSVDSLERLFSVVVGLAITLAIQKLLFDNIGNIYCFYDSEKKAYPLLAMLLDRAPSMIAFIVSIVPFYHGMNRHLDRTYVEQDVPDAKEGFLVIDFFVFFAESFLLVAFAALIISRDHAFVALMILLIVDSIWCIATHGIHYGRVKPSTLTWGWINSLAFVALVGVYWSNLFDPGVTRNWALCFVAVCRTVADYYCCWRFYFPTSSQTS